ncbi:MULTISPECIES: LacI family DNA-binding transcriptional regulator [unclassified Streptomyces]|uniref:LacI family DNA-binding transcriptional regulator n=1 Tax=Streptomyces sp. R35 TaxID=3238630 RepID=A0AB39SDW7_9ACTN|nr:LacI family transcriptional regulator [Streptomyces sp. NBC_01236]
MHDPQDGPPRAATIRDVAARAGVSPATVSRVLTGSRPVSSAAQARIQRAIKELDYVVNAQARALSAPHSRTVAILLPALSWQFHNRVASGIEQQAINEDRLCVVCSTRSNPDREIALLETLRQHNTEAVVLIGGTVVTPHYAERIARFARVLDASGSRLVLCGRPAPEPDLPITVVNYDHEGGAHAAVSHLLSLGHRSIALLGGTPHHTTTDLRIAGYRRAHEDHGITPDPGLLHLGGTDRTFGYTTVRSHLAAGRLPYTAAFCFDDYLAAGAMAAAREGGLSLPDDLSLIGYNDEPICADLYPPLNSVHVPFDELGRTAVRMALHRDDPMYSDQDVMLGTHLVMRQSVRSARARP